MFKKLVPVMMLFLSLFLCSCDGDAKIKMERNGNIYFEFNGDIGGTFKDMMYAMGGDVDIDSDAIKRELLLSGFSNVNVSTDNDFIRISFIDETRKSTLFKLGVVSENRGTISVSITPKNFMELYNTSGEDLQMLLDLFMSPVLNDEVMTEEDYVDTLNVTYGEETGNEISNSVVKFTITDKKGKSKKRSVFIKKILCGGSVYF